MKTAIVKIGNSKGLLLSKHILEKYGITDSVELRLEKDQIIIQPLASPRKDWGNEFIKMRENGDDNLLIDDVFNDENLEEWT